MLFMEAQGYDIKKNILYQDNQSTLLLEKNGKKSSSKHMKALDIHFFYPTDQIEKGYVHVVYCPTGKMWADFMSKLMQGKLFQKSIMGMDWLHIFVLFAQTTGVCWRPSVNAIIKLI